MLLVAVLGVAGKIAGGLKGGFFGSGFGHTWFDECIFLNKSSTTIEYQQ